jgi:hypothetical protein
VEILLITKSVAFGFLEIFQIVEIFEEAYIVTIGIAIIPISIFVLLETLQMPFELLLVNMSVLIFIKISPMLEV